MAVRSCPMRQDQGISVTSTRQMEKPSNRKLIGRGVLELMMFIHCSQYKRRCLSRQPGTSIHVFRDAVYRRNAPSPVKNPGGIVSASLPALFN